MCTSIWTHSMEEYMWNCFILTRDPPLRFATTPLTPSLTQKRWRCPLETLLDLSQDGIPAKHLEPTTCSSLLAEIPQLQTSKTQEPQQAGQQSSCYAHTLGQLFHPRNRGSHGCAGGKKASSRPGFEHRALNPDWPATTSPLAAGGHGNPAPSPPPQPTSSGVNGAFPPPQDHGEGGKEPTQAVSLSHQGAHQRLSSQM